jgi:hypothetical protein
MDQTDSRWYAGVGLSLGHTNRSRYRPGPNRPTHSLMPSTQPRLRRSPASGVGTRQNQGDRVLDVGRAGEVRTLLEYVTRLADQPSKQGATSNNTSWPNGTTIAGGISAINQTSARPTSSADDRRIEHPKQSSTFAGFRGGIVCTPALLLSGPDPPSRGMSHTGSSMIQGFG